MKKLKKYLFYGIWIFILGSIFGFLHETLLEYIKHGEWIPRRGLIYGPFSQVYGIGAVTLSLILYKIKNPVKLFLISTFLGGLTEYIMSLIQEYIFGTISWDYSEYFLNIYGRTSLFHAICWGIIGLLYIRYALPFIIKIISKLKNKMGYILTILLAVFLIFDILISALASIRQDQRKNKIKATTTIQTFLDKNYDDEFMDKIYNNSKYRNEKTT